MRMKSIRSAVFLFMVSAGTLAAQSQAPSATVVARSRANVAQFFLANTAELQLNDQQVTRLAAIARRVESREQTRRAAFDSLRARWSSPVADSAARATRRMEMADAMRGAAERARTERHADLRDALAVLTPDQQARAWAMRGAGARNVRGPRIGRMERGVRGRGEMRRRMRPR